ncbi:MAG: TetR/AcrR family transcriptional regulator [Bacilli bacterium]|nr:TetR/AcrR family transcriptional regulator [Bacilli bacterium]
MTTKEIIIEAAEKEFIAKGYANTTLRRIASKCNITATAIYRHFEDKEDIFQTVIKPFVDRIKSQAEEIEKKDYDFLNNNELDSVWEFEEECNPHFELLFNFKRPLVMLVIRERREWLKNYLLDIEYSSTMRYLKRMEELGYKVAALNPLSFKAILESYIDAYFHVLEMNLSLAESKKVCQTISEFFQSGFRKLLGF